MDPYDGIMLAVLGGWSLLVLGLLARVLGCPEAVARCCPALRICGRAATDSVRRNDSRNRLK